MPQDYPRTEKGLLDEARLRPHTHKIPFDELKGIIRTAIASAARKSRREILELPEGLSDDERNKIYRQKGKELFAYFKKYYGDPAATAYDCLGKHYREIAIEQFRNQTLQKQRMNSGWRYQYIAKDCAVRSRRFVTVSDIGAMEADFNATMNIIDSAQELNIYISIKNRSNTMGGQDWPKAIAALEVVARTDKNRSGPYICVFGIAIDKGQRQIRRAGKTKTPHSVNTEVWLSDFFWPFFSNYTYAEIAKAVFEVLMETSRKGQEQLVTLIPDELINSFGDECRGRDLLDAEGKFNDPLKLIDVFCNTKPYEPGVPDNQ
jgi:hypothetical protein